MMWGSGYGMGWFGAVMMLAVWVLFVIGIVWLVLTVTVQGRDGGGARRILDERFAAGEVRSRSTRLAARHCGDGPPSILIR